jgi:hypothetical protein
MVVHACAATGIEAHCAVARRDDPRDKPVVEFFT